MTDRAHRKIYLNIYQCYLIWHNNAPRQGPEAVFGGPYGVPRSDTKYFTASNWLRFTAKIWSRLAIKVRIYYAGYLPSFSEGMFSLQPEFYNSLHSRFITYALNCILSNWGLTPPYLPIPVINACPCTKKERLKQNGYSKNIKSNRVLFNRNELIKTKIGFWKGVL